MDRTHTGSAVPRSRNPPTPSRTQSTARSHHALAGIAKDSAHGWPIARIRVLAKPSPDDLCGLEVRAVRNGRGLVAVRGFRTRERVMEVLGTVVSARAVWGWWQSSPRRAANCFRLAGDRYLDPSGRAGAFANHGCRPNVRVVARGDRLWFEAIRAIRPGDEVLHDYATLLGADDVWTMRCRCGSRGCRGRVERFDRLPEQVINYYQSIRAIPGFILRTSGATPSTRR
jgi:hypothetical protein